jgi:ubiquitin-activating enzyme E1
MEPQIDTDLYSRQIFCLGLETLNALAKTNVLLCGLSGLGVEVGKNLVLAGPSSVTVFDPEVCGWSDLSSQFFLTEEDVVCKRNRAAASVQKLSELNPYVRVVLHEDKNLSEAFLSQFEVMIVCNGSLELATRLDAFCHAHGKGFIRGEARGPFGSIFVDFGPHFVVTDTDGRAKEEYVLFVCFVVFSFFSPSSFL